MKSIKRDSFAAAFQLVVILYLFFYPSLPNKKLPSTATDKTTPAEKTPAVNSPTQNSSKTSPGLSSGLNKSGFLTSIEGIPNVMFGK
ncbi:hypothetical protein [Ferruginibacter sp.]